MRLLFIVAGLLYALSAVSQTKVAVLDTGLDLTDPRFRGKLCATGHKVYGNATINDTVGHGTHVAGTITRYAGASDYCLVIYKVFVGGREVNNAIIRAVLDAATEGVTIVNMSFGGPTFSEYERLAILAHPGITFVAAAGNDGMPENGIYRYYPAAYNLPNIQVVGALGLNGFRLPISNYGANVNYWELGVVDSYMPYNSHKVQIGTSMAAAVRTGKLIKERQAK